MMRAQRLLTALTTHSQARQLNTAIHNQHRQNWTVNTLHKYTAVTVRSMREREATSHTEEAVGADTHTVRAGNVSRVQCSLFAHSLCAGGGRSR